MAASSQELPQLRTKFLKRLYEPAVLLHAFGKVRGQRIKPRCSDEEDSSANRVQTRRKFVDGIAYLCSYKKCPDFVTAAALQPTPQGITVWLAANRGVQPEVIAFAKELLKDLEELSWASLDAGSLKDLETAVFQKILADVIHFLRPRLRVYVSQLTTYLGICLRSIQERRNQDDECPDSPLAQLELWMQNKLVLIYDMSTNTTLFGKLVRECYTERNSSALREVKRLSGPGSHREQDFEKLFGFHYKLGKVVSVSGHLISAAISLRQEFANGFKVRTVPHAQDRKIPLVAKKLKIGGVVNRMFKANDAQRDLYHERLRSLHSEAELEKILCAGVKVQTRVHAELLLIDHFERNKAVFLDGDKYIGCSKPACYLCYHYISNHPNGYTTPPSHQKLYLAWRVPDTQKNDITHLQTQEKIMSKLIEKVREDLKREMRSQKPALPLHPDSTCGLTTTAPSLAPFMDLSGLAQSLED